MSKYDAQRRYDATHTARIAIKLNISTDADILDWLNAQPNKQGAIKMLIRSEIKKAVSDNKEVKDIT